MRSQIIKQTGAGTTAWIPLDPRAQVFAVGMGAVVSGTATYTIEYTFDAIMDPLYTATPTAFPHATMVNQTASSAGNFAFPCTAVRINQASGSGSVTLTILQSTGQG
jgi:hypothetical protein